MVLNGDVNGKVAIVTGSTSGIGKASALALAAAGYSVVLHSVGEDDHGVQAEFRAQNYHAVYSGADLRDPEAAAQKLVSCALGEFGRIDVIVNNAAMILHKPTRDVRHEDWSAMLAVNVEAPFFLVQASVDELVRRQGCVIMISSTNALVVNRRNIVYDTSKAALNHAALALALELRDLGVRVNTLMPGGTQSPTLDRWAVEYAGGEQQAKEIIDDGVRQGTIASPEQIAAGVVLLASGGASWINGAAIPIDGGFRLGA